MFYTSFELICICCSPSCPYAGTHTQGPVLLIAPGPELALDGPGRDDCLLAAKRHFAWNFRKWGAGASIVPLFLFLCLQHWDGSASCRDLNGLTSFTWSISRGWSSYFCAKSVHYRVYLIRCLWGLWLNHLASNRHQKPSTGFKSA